MAVGSLSAAALPAGLAVSAHEYVSVWPSTSLDCEPSSVTGVPMRTFSWSGPAFATGTELVVLMTTVSGALLRAPSLTINCATKVPGRSTVNDGPALVGFTSTARLPGGTLINDQWNMSGSPSTSDEPVPLRNATWAATTVWSGPASATGAELSVVMVTVSGALTAFGSETIS